MTTTSFVEREIGRHVFGLPDQETFARLSLDRNPMHVDPVAARRLLTGRPVVHGMHVLIACLEHWTPCGSPIKLDCNFNSAISVGDEVVFTEKISSARQVLLQASVGGVVCTNLRITLDSSGAESPLGAHDASHNGDSVVALADRHEPLELVPTEHVGKRYRLAISCADPAEHFPAASHLLGPARIGGLMALSRFVGMVCPGLHSIFASVSLKLDAPPAGEASVDFQVEQFDERFNMFGVTLSGAVSGRLTAFQRPPPTLQATVAEIAAHVGANEFGATCSLVIGASRGLGELVAKILAAGGGDVVLGYAHGLEDIQRLAAEIDASGRGRCRIDRFDVDAMDRSELDLDTLDAIYYFATPRIGRKKNAVFAAALFDEFVSFYARRLHELCMRVERGGRKNRLRIYVPSSVYIDDRPDGMTEYAMAKAATEVLIQDINRKFRKVEVRSSRLPKLNTDQTASVIPERNADNLAVLLPVVRSMVA